MGVKLHTPTSQPIPFGPSQVEAHESTRERLESSPPKGYEDHIARKGYNSMTHYNLVLKFIPMLQAMKIPDAKAAVDKELKKLETNATWQLDKVKRKNRLFWKHREAKRLSTLLHWWTSVISKKADLEPKFQKYMSSRTPRWHCNDDSGAYAVFTERGTSASQMTAAKLMDVTARLPDCDGQGADAKSAYTRLNMENAPRLLRIPKSELSRYMDTSSTAQMTQIMGTQ